jgi:hypothetical protein
MSIEMIGAIANNRFLWHTNPIMSAAITDGGSVLDREYIQRAARGIVDAGHLDDLAYIILAGLANTRTSGTDVYVSEVYDLSGNTHNATQPDDDYQPKVVDGFFRGDYITPWLGTCLRHDDHMPLVGQNSFTIMCWVKIDDVTVPENIYGYWLMNERGEIGTTIGRPVNYSLSFNKSSGQFYFFIMEVSTSTIIPVYSTTSPLDDTWYHVAATCNDATNEIKIYVNGSLEGTSDFSTITRDKNGEKSALMGAAWSADLITDFYAGFALVGYANDFRGYTKVLTETEIAKIYNETSYRY